MEHLTVDDGIFDKLKDAQSSLSRNNQNLIPILMDIFIDFKNRLLKEVTGQFQELVSVLKVECLETSRKKDAKISKLESTCESLHERVLQLENKVDDEDAYIRRETLIFSGDAVIPTTSETTCSEIVIKQIKDKLKINITPGDISVTHRLGPQSAQQGPERRSITAKFCRRDLKRDILLAARRMKPNALFVNESLTKPRQKISKALRKAKQLHPNIVSGMTTIDGRIFVWTKNPNNEQRDIRHLVSTLGRLEDFCREHIGLPSIDFLAA